MPFVVFSVHYLITLGARTSVYDRCGSFKCCGFRSESGWPSLRKANDCMDRVRQCARWDDRHCHECGFAMKRTSRITARCTGKETQAWSVKSAPAVVPQIDHRIGNGFECVVQLTETLRAQQQAPELVFPGELPLDGT